jgi:hypothetical protein
MNPAIQAIAGKLLSRKLLGMSGGIGGLVAIALAVGAGTIALPVGLAFGGIVAALTATQIITQYKIDMAQIVADAKAKGIPIVPPTIGQIIKEITAPTVEIPAPAHSAPSDAAAGAGIPAAPKKVDPYNPGPDNEG